MLDSLHVVMVYLQCFNLTSGALENFFHLFLHVLVELELNDAKVALILLREVNRLIVISNLLELCKGHFVQLRIVF